jgi:CheY-like chemotaxis protein
MKKVLIFDDNLEILELCSIILRSKGYQTSTESHCRDVIHCVREYQPDVILMDNWMPDIGGIAATHLIKDTEDIRHIPVIFFSANNEAENISKEARADYFLQKPFDIDELEAMVSRAIVEHQPVAIS